MEVLAFGLVLVGFLSLFVWAFVVPDNGSRGKDAVRKVQAANWPFFYMNRREGVTAICTREAFTVELSRFLVDLEADKVKSWERVTFRPRQTFTFAKNEATKRPIHTGYEGDLERFGEIIFRSITGYRRDQVRRGFYEKALKFICREDERLFVPFAAGKSDELKIQAEHYGHRKIDEFEKLVTAAAS